MSVRDARALIPEQSTSTPSRVETKAPSSSRIPAIVVLTWQREGGLAGFCDAVTLYDSGKVAVSSCRHNRGTPELMALDADQYHRLREWVGRYQSFTWQQSDDPGVVDGMMETMKFSGQGSEIAGPAVMQLMRELVSGLGR